MSERRRDCGGRPRATAGRRAQEEGVTTWCGGQHAVDAVASHWDLPTRSLGPTWDPPHPVQRQPYLPPGHMAQSRPRVRQAWRCCAESSGPSAQSPGHRLSTAASQGGLPCQDKQGAQGRRRRARPGGTPWHADPAPWPGGLSSGLPRSRASPHPPWPHCPPRQKDQPAALWAAVANFSSFDSGPASLQGVSLIHLGAEHHLWLTPPGRGASRSLQAPSRGPLGTWSPLHR